MTDSPSSNVRVYNATYCAVNPTAAAREIERLQQRVAELEQWNGEASETLGVLARFLQKIKAPHAVDWREWIGNAEKMLCIAEPPIAVVYTPCAQHMGLSWRMHIPYQPPPRLVCPICEPPTGAAVTKPESFRDNHFTEIRNGVDWCKSHSQPYSECVRILSAVEKSAVCRHGRPADHCDACEEDIERSHTDSLIEKLESVTAPETNERRGAVDYCDRCGAAMEHRACCPNSIAERNTTHD